MDDEESCRPPSPTQDKVSALRRKSSMGRSIRKSRSVMGIAFEDQIAAIDANLSTADRLRQMINMSFSAAAMLVQQDYDGEADIDNPQADLADHIRSTLGRQAVVKQETLDRISADLEKALADKQPSTSKPLPKLPPRLRNLNDIVDKTEAESKAWKDMHHERRTALMAAKTERKMVSAHEKVADKADNMSKSEEAWLRGVSDGQSEWDKLKKQEKRMAIAILEMSKATNKRKKAVEDCEAALSVAAIKLSEVSAQKAEDVSDVSRDNVVLSEQDFVW